MDDQALFRACQEGNVVKVRSMLSFNNNVTYSSLIIALDDHCDEILCLLLEFIEKREMKGETVYCAARNGNIRFLELAKKRGWSMNEEHESKKPIHAAAIAGRAEVISFLIESGVSVTERDSNNYSPIHHASVKGHSHVVDLLLRQGVDVDLYYGCGSTPLLLAIIGGNLKTLMLLLSAGADVTKCDMKPLFAALLQSLDV